MRMNDSGSSNPGRADPDDGTASVVVGAGVVAGALT